MSNAICHQAKDWNSAFRFAFTAVQIIVSFAKTTVNDFFLILLSILFYDYDANNIVYVTYLIVYKYLTCVTDINSFRSLVCV